MRCHESTARRVDGIIRSAAFDSFGPVVPHHPDLIEHAGRVLFEAATKPARIIVFGSAARGEAGEDSDVDFLVIQKVVSNRAAEAVRLRRALGDLGVPVDVVVLDEELAMRRAKVPGTMVHHALREGRVVAQS
jgi:predicted nucleotidyltransferase